MCSGFFCLFVFLCLPAFSFVLNLEPSSLGWIVHGELADFLRVLWLLKGMRHCAHSSPLPLVCVPGMTCWFLIAPPGPNSRKAGSTEMSGRNGTALENGMAPGRVVAERGQGGSLMLFDAWD